MARAKARWACQNEAVIPLGSTENLFRFFLNGILFCFTWAYPYGPESPCGMQGNPIYSSFLPPILAAPIDPPPGPWEDYEPNL